MYRPHEAREDTELFPKLRSIVSADEFDAMAEDYKRDVRRAVRKSVIASEAKQSRAGAPSLDCFVALRAPRNNEQFWSLR
jgi:hypothetical protein